MEFDCLFYADRLVGVAVFLALYYPLMLVLGLIAEDKGVWPFWVVARDGRG